MDGKLFVKLKDLAAKQAQRSGFDYEAEDFGQEFAIYCERRQMSYEDAQLCVRRRWIDFIRKYRSNYRSLKLSSASEAEYKRKIRQTQTIPLNEEIAAESEKLFSTIDKLHLTAIYAKLTKYERLIFSLRFMLRFTASEVAKMAGSTTEAVAQESWQLLCHVKRVSTELKRRGRPRKQEQE